MSDTPMTDKREKASEDVTSYCIDGWAMARSLERKLTEAQNVIRRYHELFGDKPEAFSPPGKQGAPE